MKQAKDRATFRAAARAPLTRTHFVADLIFDLASFKSILLEEAQAQGQAQASDGGCNLRQHAIFHIMDYPALPSLAQLSAPMRLCIDDRKPIAQLLDH
jgi:hypothetical protein